MVSSPNLSVIFPIGIVVFCLFFLLFGLGDRTVVYTDIKEESAGIANIFVPFGKKYSPKNNAIYHCLSRDVFKTWNAQVNTRDFIIDAKHKSEGAESRAKSFQSVFDTQKWNPQKTPGADKMSENYQSSGLGSSLEAGQPPLALLNSLIERLKIYLKKPVVTILDIPCGDFYWIRHLVGSRSDVQYTGVDIVPTLIERHKMNYRTWMNVNFQNLDIISSGLNKSYDIIFSRDFLQHLTFADAMKALEHFSASGSKLLVTTQMQNPANAEINIKVRYRPLNLMVYPFDLIAPVCTMKDNYRNKLKELSVWTLPLRQKDIRY